MSAIAPPAGQSLDQKSQEAINDMTMLVVNGQSSVQEGMVQTAEKAAGLMEDNRKLIKALAEAVDQLRKENVGLRAQLATQDRLHKALSERIETLSEHQHKSLVDVHKQVHERITNTNTVVTILSNAVTELAKHFHHHLKH